MINKRAMHEPQLSAGEAKERQRALQKQLLFAGLFVVGLASGIYVGVHVGRSGDDFSAPWPPVASALIAAAYLAAMAFGSVMLSRRTDEFERGRQYKAAAFAGAVYFTVYPVWFVLWKGGFVLEPVHWQVFVLFWLSLLGATIYYRLR